MDDLPLRCKVASILWSMVFGLFGRHWFMLSSGGASNMLERVVS